MLALAGTFDFHQVGGTDSYVRRLSLGCLAQEPGMQIEWVFYGPRGRRPAEETPAPGLTVQRLERFEEAMAHLRDGRFDHVVVAQLRPADRLRLRPARDLCGSRAHRLEFFFGRGPLRRWLKFRQVRRAGLDGTVFCASGRIQRYLAGLGCRAMLLPPPVPAEYFDAPAPADRRAPGQPAKLLFLGRIDPRKGAAAAMELMTALARAGRYRCEIRGIRIAADPPAQRLHRRLLDQSAVPYVPIERQGWSASLETQTVEALGAADIFVQPYCTLDSTVDTPLLLLEAMARGCAVLTTPVGEVAAVYGDSPFVTGPRGFVASARRLLENLDDERLRQERARVRRQAAGLGVRADHVCRIFLDELDR